MPFEKGHKAAVGADHSKRKIVTQHLIAELNESDKDGATRLRKIIKKLLDNAESGDTQAIREVFDRVQGKPAQAIIGDDTEAPVKIETVFKWAGSNDGK